MSRHKRAETGYLHRHYARSFNESGDPLELPRSKGWVLERQIPGFTDSDASGCYPLFCCQNWRELHTDLDALDRGLVCLSIVTDPFGDFDETYLNQCFGDLVLPLKEHFVIDLNESPKRFVHPHHQRNATKALKNVAVETCDRPADFIDTWVNLYSGLVKRRKIKGMADFTKQTLSAQLNVPGLIALRAVHDDETVGMVLWYMQGDVAYYHLGAYSNGGYDLGVSFALFWSSITHFVTTDLKWLNLGAGAGISSQGMDGLSRFKKGWATGTRTAYFCGRVFDRQRFVEITKQSQVPDHKYFPPYRAGEFI